MKRPLCVLAGIALLDVGLTFGVIHLLERGTETPIINMVNVERPTQSPNLISGKPIKLKIPKLNMDLPIKEGNYNSFDNSWTIDNKSAFYATMTPELNNLAGNTLVYGHNSNQVFGKLNQLKINDVVQVESLNQKIFTYKLSEIKDVEPTDLSLFEYRGEPILTIQTCSGTWNERRRLFMFRLNEVVGRV